jgi:hypothetical protein
MTLSHRQFVRGAGVAGLGLLAGCGCLPPPDGDLDTPGRHPHESCRPRYPNRSVSRL